MTTSTAPLLERAEHALDDRAGASLFAVRGVSRPIATLAHAETVSRDVAVLKAGRFHGGAVVLDDLDLESIVGRFDRLFDGVFVPPWRIDHGISAAEVVGYFEALRVAELPDPSNAGTLTPYLLADVRWIDADVVADLRRPLLERRYRNRSSELGAYETNAGEVFPLVLYGCAFVDIPAVEGLDAAPIRLRTLPTPAALVALSERPPVTDTTDTTPVEVPVDGEAPATTDVAPEIDPAAEVDVAPELEPGAEAAVEPDVDDGATADNAATGQGDEPPSENGGAEPVDPEGTPPGEGSATADVAPVTEEGATALAGQRDTIDLHALRDADPEVALRAIGLTAQADALLAARRVELERVTAGYVALGAIVPGNREAATMLLSHTSPDVRAAATALLDTLGARKAVRVDTDPSRVRPAVGFSDVGATLTVTMTEGEVGAAWLALTPAERKLRQPEYDAWRAARADAR